MSGHGPDGLPRIASISVPLRSAQWPRFDQHIGVTLPSRHLTEAQLPAERTLHYYADSFSGAAERINGLAVRWAEGRAVVEVGLDPGFEAVDHLAS